MDNQLEGGTHEKMGGEVLHRERESASHLCLSRISVIRLVVCIRLVHSLLWKIFINEAAQLLIVDGIIWSIQSMLLEG